MDMTLHHAHWRRSFSYSEKLCISRGDCPSPFADAVAGMVQNGVSIKTTAKFYRIAPRQVERLVEWVERTNKEAENGPGPT